MILPVGKGEYNIPDPTDVYKGVEASTFNFFNFEDTSVKLHTVYSRARSDHPTGNE